MSKRVIELFGFPDDAGGEVDWHAVARRQWCPFLDRKCLKVRKSQPKMSIGTCSVEYGKDDKLLVICPFRLLERQQIFTDCLHLLTMHEPGNELHLVAELTVPGGNVDYFIASVDRGKVKDFVGVELQTLDSTGTVWPARQRLLHGMGVRVTRADRTSRKPFGINWKMTAKTILVQLHHKIKTFEHINKHLVLAVQDHLLEYMRAQFSFDHVRPGRIGDPMHFHSYTFRKDTGGYRVRLLERHSTDAEGIATCLGLQASPHVSSCRSYRDREEAIRSHLIDSRLSSTSASREVGSQFVRVSKSRAVQTLYDYDRNPSAAEWSGEADGWWQLEQLTCRRWSPRSNCLENEARHETRPDHR